jgi:hypothetical protein
MIPDAIARKRATLFSFFYAGERPKSRRPSIQCRERLSGLLKFYHLRSRHQSLAFGIRVGGTDLNKPNSGG